MKNALNFIRDNKTKIITILTIILLTIIVIGIVYVNLEAKKKRYSLKEVNQYNYYQLNIDGKYGVIDTKGNTVVEAIYDNVKIPNPEKAVFICQKGDKTIALNDKKEEIFTQYDEVTAISINGVVSNIPYEKEVLRYKQNEKYGLINYDGKTITKPIYEEISGLENKESELLVKIDDKYGVINSKGAKLIKVEYDNIAADGFYEEANKYEKSGYIVTNKTTDGYKYGYISYKLEKLLDVEYNEINRVQDLQEDIYIIAAKNGKYGVQKNKKTIINFSYQGIEYNSEDKLFEIQRNTKFGIFDIYGNEIIPIEYNELEKDGIYIRAIKDNEEIYFNTLGNKIDDLKYKTIIAAGESYYITVNEEGLYGIINKQKQEVIENKYNYIEYLFGEYFIASKEKDNLGVIDINDNVVIDFKYDVVQRIEDTKVVEGKILKENISDLYSENLQQINSDKNVAVYKENDYIVVYSKVLTKYFNLKGEEISIKDILKNNKLFAVYQDGKAGYENENGEIQVDCKYDKVTEFNEYGYAGIKQKDKWGIINEKGEVIVEPVYIIEENNKDPEFLGEYYKVYYGYGEVYYTNHISE